MLRRIFPHDLVLCIGLSLVACNPTEDAEKSGPSSMGSSVDAAAGDTPIGDAASGTGSNGEDDASLGDAQAEADAQSNTDGGATLSTECQQLPVIEPELFLVDPPQPVDMHSGTIYALRGGGFWGATMVGLAIDESTGEETEIASFELPSIALGGNTWEQSFAGSEFSTFSRDHFIYRVGEPYDVNDPTQNLYAVPLTGGDPVLVDGFSAWVGDRRIVSFHRTGQVVLVDRGGGGNCTDGDNDDLYDCSCDVGPNLARMTGPDDFELIDIAYCPASDISVTSKRIMWQGIAVGANIDLIDSVGEYQVFDLETGEHIVLGPLGSLELGGISGYGAWLVTMGDHDYVQMLTVDGETVGFVPLDGGPPYAEVPCQLGSTFDDDPSTVGTNNYDYGDSASIGFTVGLSPLPLDHANLDRHKSVLIRHDVITRATRAADLSYLSTYVGRSDQYIYVQGISDFELRRITIADYPLFFSD